MIEISGFVMGGIFVALVPFAVLVGVALLLWESWWLYPAWALLLVPLGVPGVSFWQFAALNMFLSVMLTNVPQNNYATESDQTKRRAAGVRVVAFLLRPVLAYYFIRWAL